MRRYALGGSCAIVAAVTLAAVLDSQLAAQQVIRAGAYLVQVDAYPLRDGKPIEGLTKDDFILLEDGKPQQIDSLRFLEFPTWTPETARRDPRTQRESFELAADPSNRVFAVYLNRIRWQNGNYVQPALYDFLDRTIGARDYVGIITQMQGPGDIVFGQLTTAFKGEIQRFLDIVDPLDPKHLTPPELELMACFPIEHPALIARWRLDDVYRDLEGLIALLGSLRETRSTLIFVSESMTDPAKVPQLTRPGPPTAPRLTPPAGQVPPPSGRGSFSLPAGGYRIAEGRCDDLLKAVNEPWDPDRFEDLVAKARSANVALNPINPRGLFASANLAAVDGQTANDELMRTMANETGGLAMVTTNDMKEAFVRVADHVSSHYLLSYYSSNRNQDGRVRRITVKLKSSGDTIASRKEYRAPSAAEAAPPPPPAPGSGAAARAALPPEFERALFDLERNDREAVGGEPARPADPSAPTFSRAPSPPAAPWQPVTRRRFARTERIRLQWLLKPGGLTALPTNVRLLDREGRALPATFTLTRDDASQTVSATMSLAPLAMAVYVVEAELPDGTKQFVAFRIG